MPTIPRPARRSGASTPCPHPASPAATPGRATQSAARGGGGTWMTGSYDPSSACSIGARATRTPTFYGADRQGDNLYTDVVARDRGGHRQAALALSIHAARHARLGLEPCARAGDAAMERRRAARRHGRESQRLLLRHRSRDGRALARQALYGDDVGARDRRRRAADRAERRRQRRLLTRCVGQHELQSAVVRPEASACSSSARARPARRSTASSRNSCRGKTRPAASCGPTATRRSARCARSTS